MFTTHPTAANFLDIMKPSYKSIEKFLSGSENKRVISQRTKQKWPLII